MKDFLGQELAVGDTVATMVPEYRSLRKLVIKSFTPQNVRLDDARSWDPDRTFLQSPTQVIKVPLK